MAKTGVFDSDPVVMSKATELKKELQKFVKSIVDDDDYRIETIDQAKETLCALRDLKIKKRSLSLKLRETVSCPDEFKCPLSKELMKDPVILATGQTYDRPFIQKWLRAGNRTCPLTQQVLSHTVLTPNHLIREMISQWCKNQGLELPDPVRQGNGEGITEAERDQFLSLVGKMSSELPEQRAAAKELRRLTKRMPSFRALFGESVDAIPQLLNPLLASKSASEVQADLQEDVITTLLNLSIHDNNKKLVAETPAVIPLLIEALRSGTIDTRTNAAAALFTLSALDSNKSLIGKSGALKPLIDLLEEGHPLAMKDVASAIFTLCFVHENKARAVRDGAVRVLLKKIMDGMLVDELLAMLAILSSHHKAIEEMGELGAVPCLLRIIRENSCERNKENCIAILHTICSNDRTKWKTVREEENAYGTISKLAREGTSRAKRKANGILEKLNRIVNLTHTA
ncbi:U-box domain-containing protein 9 [Ricinus communis]|uniref:RING-type E3 ubiquitin transferase n=1 Tax=Ricinus communis TaxID=3988 RepID=B9T5I0_RICCO|nr:U-box domain-containing protein 9 [Ricinus communis]EEF28886.1 Spotted leaf protein, putative [Ricinus communis]|eukprot:XP_002533499.1 U-box domain-containing protein 9 [Ricinus communis]